MSSNCLQIIRNKLAKCAKLKENTVKAGYPIQPTVLLGMGNTRTVAWRLIIPLFVGCNYERGDNICIG